MVALIAAAGESEITGHAPHNETLDRRIALASAAAPC